MEEFKIILSLIGTALGLLITSITFFLKYLKSTKVKKAAQNLIKFSSILLGYIEDAEKLIHYTGKEKKEFVMTKASTYLIKHDIELNLEALDKNIEDLIQLTKNVNVQKIESPKELKKFYAQK